MTTKTSDLPEMAIVWEDPPEEVERPDYAFFYEQLKTRRGKWARYPGTQSAASHWCATRPEFEYRSKLNDHGRSVWMRYVGTT